MCLHLGTITKWILLKAKKTSMAHQCMGEVQDCSQVLKLMFGYLQISSFLVDLIELLWVQLLQEHPPHRPGSLLCSQSGRRAVDTRTSKTNSQRLNLELHAHPSGPPTQAQARFPAATIHTGKEVKK